MAMESARTRRVVLALVAVSVAVGVSMVAVPAGAPAAETHSNCATFDNNGVPISVTPNCSETVHAASPPNSFPGANPCTGDPGTITLNDNHSIFHVNVNGAGDVWVTGTDGGAASFVADSSSAPSGSGTWTSWFGGSLNSTNTVLHSTMHLGIHLSDGSTVTMHDTMHMTIKGMTPVVVFDKPTLICGG